MTPTDLWYDQVSDSEKKGKLSNNCPRINYNDTLTHGFATVSLQKSKFSTFHGLALSPNIPYKQIFDLYIFLTRHAD